MESVKPLQCLVRPKSAALPERVLSEWAAHFEGAPRVEVTLTSTGLLVKCIWFGDLDDVSAKLHELFDGELTWSEPEIAYRTETATSTTGATREITLEPRMTVEVETPEELAGTVMGDLSSRRGIIHAMADATRGKLIKAEVPLSELKGYPNFLRSATGSRAVATVEFSTYSEAPRGQGPWPDEPASAAMRA